MCLGIFCNMYNQRVDSKLCCAQATASITAQNFLAPADDLGYKVEYRHPYFWSGNDPRRTALALSIFNARKLSGVFTPGARAPVTRIGLAAMCGSKAVRRCQPLFVSSQIRQQAFAGICLANTGADHAGMHHSFASS